ncbi:MAG: hypothetical protein ACJAY8_001187, partial [Sphingobacteriales bacterium]
MSDKLTTFYVKWAFPTSPQLEKGKSSRKNLPITGKDKD